METYIIDGMRSPMGMKNGNLMGVRPDDLTTDVVKVLLERNSTISPSNIEDMVIGCAFPEGSQGFVQE